jgi:hypothetical protein
VNRHVETSGQCPIFTNAAEDVSDLLFQCDTVKQPWTLLGLNTMIKKASLTNRSRFVVLEQLLRNDAKLLPVLTLVKRKLLWWLAGIHGGYTGDEPMMNVYPRYFNVRCQCYPLQLMRQRFHLNLLMAVHVGLDLTPQKQRHMLMVHFILTLMQGQWGR